MQHFYIPRFREDGMPFYALLDLGSEMVIGDKSLLYWEAINEARRQSINGPTIQVLPVTHEHIQRCIKWNRVIRL